MQDLVFNIQPTNLKDLPSIYNFFDQAIDYQKRNNYPVWPDYDKGLLIRDIEENKQFKLVVDDQMACVFTICYEDKIVWREKDTGDSLYLHRVAVNPIFKGNRLFGHINNWCAKRAEKNNLLYVRMDTWADNPSLVNYYMEFGYEIVEYFMTPDSDELPIQQRGNNVVLLQLEVLACQ